MPHILIVDDDDHQRLLYREQFEEDGFEVEEARDGREALDRVRARRPDVVVMDIDMPGRDGLDALASLHDLDRRLPIVLNTAYAAYRDQYVSWIADAYVVKSSNLAELRSAVASALAARRGASV